MALAPEARFPSFLGLSNRSVPKMSLWMSVRTKINRLYGVSILRIRTPPPLAELQAALWTVRQVTVAVHLLTATSLFVRPCWVSGIESARREVICAVELVVLDRTIGLPVGLPGNVVSVPVAIQLARFVTTVEMPPENCSELASMVPLWTGMNIRPRLLRPAALVSVVTAQAT